MRFFPSGKPSFPMLARIGCALIVAAAAGSGQAQYVGNRLGGGFYDPHGLAIDGSGNVYVADFGNNAVKEIPSGCASSSCVITLGGGFDQPSGVAVDGSGNVYVADSRNNAVKEMPAGCASSSCVTPLGGGFNYPEGVAVDGSGTVYVADPGNEALEEIPTGCTSAACVISLGSGFFAEPDAVAVSGTGEIYAAVPGAGAVVEMPSTCMSLSCEKFVGAGGKGPDAVAVDGSGNIFFSSGANDAVKARPPACLFSYACSTFLGGDFISPWGIAVDRAGNVYVPDWNNGTVRQMVGAGLIFGNVGAPLDATTQYTEVAPGDDVEVSGWAAYPEQGGPVSKVTVLIDGTAVSDATLGIANSTLATNYANPSYYTAGWTFTAPTTGLAAGNHKVSAIAYTSLNVPVYLAAQKFTISEYPFQAAPTGGIDEAIDATTQYTTIAQSDNLYVQGWATAVTGGFPISKVVICLDSQCGYPVGTNTPIGDATTGFPRPGIVARFNNSAYLDSGWEFTMAASGLPLGSHLVCAYDYYTIGSQGEWTDLGCLPIMVSAAAVNAPPFGSLGEAVDATTQTTTVSQSDNLHVQGWAVDPQQGAPVSSVSILIDGTAVGNATLGAARPTVAAQYHNAAYLHSGWTFTMSASGLSAGIHEVTAVATDALGLTKQLGVAFITVTE